MRSIEATGKTIEDAIRNGLNQLGVDRDSTSVEVLENPKSGFLGFGGNPARVRVTVMEEEEDVLAAVAAAAAPIPPVEESAPVTAEPAPQPAESAAVEEPAAAVEEAPVPEAAPVSAARQDSTDEVRMQRAKEFLETLLEKMHTPATASTAMDEEGNLRIDLSGDDMGLVIGRRGETLDALQHITSFAVNRGESRRLRVLLDTEHYRARREDSLRGLARKTASKVVKYRRNLTLEPMNAYERHVIHEALQDWRDVTTASTGTDPNRRVVVQYTPHR